MISKRNCIQSDVWEKLKTLSTRSCFWKTLPLSPARSCTSTVARAQVTDQNGAAASPPLFLQFQFNDRNRRGTMAIVVTVALAGRGRQAWQLASNPVADLRAY